MVKRERKNPKRAGALIYINWMESMLDMPDAMLLQTVRALWNYLVYGDEPSDPNVKYGAFGMMRPVLDKDADAFEAKVAEISKKRSEAGKKGGAKAGNTNAIREKTSKVEQMELTITPTPSISFESPLEFNARESREEKKEIIDDFGGEWENGYQRLDSEKFENAVKAFAKEQGLSEDDAVKFVWYHINNGADNDPSKTFYYLPLKDIHGKPMKNWRGAFIKFIKGGYNKYDWATEHGKMDPELAKELKARAERKKEKEERQKKKRDNATSREITKLDIIERYKNKSNDENYCTFLDWIVEKTPITAKTLTPLSEEEFNDLKNEYGRGKIGFALERIEECDDVIWKHKDMHHAVRQYIMNNLVNENYSVSKS